MLSSFWRLWVCLSTDARMPSSPFVDDFFKFGLKGVYHSLYLFLADPYCPLMSWWPASIFFLVGLQGGPHLILSGLHFGQLTFQHWSISVIKPPHFLHQFPRDNDYTWVRVGNQVYWTLNHYIYKWL
jgi:hypothetical protein